MTERLNLQVAKRIVVGVRDAMDGLSEGTSVSGALVIDSPATQQLLWIGFGDDGSVTVNLDRNPVIRYEKDETPFIREGN